MTPSPDSVISDPATASTRSTACCAISVVTAGWLTAGSTLTDVSAALSVLTVARACCQAELTSKVVPVEDGFTANVAPLRTMAASTGSISAATAKSYNLLSSACSFQVTRELDGRAVHANL